MSFETLYMKKTYHNSTPCWNPISKVAFLLLDSGILIFTIAGIFQDVIGMQKSKEPPSPSIPQSYRVFHNLPQCHFQDVTPLPAFVCPIKTVPKNSLDLWTNLVSVCVCKTSSTSTILYHISSGCFPKRHCSFARK